LRIEIHSPRIQALEATHNEGNERDFGMDQDFDRKIELSLNRDEAIVLFGFLSRELYQYDESRLKPLLEHEAEAHSLLALFHEMIPKLLLDTGGPDADQIYAAASEYLLGRHR